jgi:hypothetical protein
MFGDPISWLKVCLKLRFSKVDPLGEIEHSRQQTPPAPAFVPKPASV